MIKKLAIIGIVLAIAVIMILFTDRNPGLLPLDLAFGVVEPSIAMAISVTFVAGWLFGLLCTCLYFMRLVNERRRLRNALRHAESEVSRMRNLPLADAD